MQNAPAVLVTGIGGNVGQGILRVLRQCYPGLRLIGTDVGALTAGHRYCDAFHQVPYGYEPGYAEAISRICGREEIRLVIPSTDHEVVQLGRIAGELPPLIASPPETARIFLDKMETHRAFLEAGLPFARSWLPGSYRGERGQIIVKPREGRGSRGLHINPSEPGAFGDEFMVQELLTGTEITTAFYVTKRKRLHGFITFERTLVSGMTERCEITHAHDGMLQRLIAGMISRYDLRGPCNVQAMATPGGEVVPFEVNCRYSGTTSIRAQLGFPDVVFGVQEYLLQEEPAASAIPERGAAVRVYLDVIYPDRGLGDIRAGDGGSFVF